MCFSAEADLAAGIVVGVIGVDALRHVQDRRELALASLPAVFGAHQLTEVFVWWNLTGRASASVGRAATLLYLAVALVVLPVLVPLAVRAVEPLAHRRRQMAALAGLGAVVAGVFLVSMIRGPVIAEINGNSINYRKDVAYGGAVTGLYLLAGCLPLLLSSHRRIATFGAANVVAVAVLTWVASAALTSLWCAWAAVTSVMIAAHVRRADPLLLEARHRLSSLTQAVQSRRSGQSSG